jgi:hypothetical protein
MRLSGDPDFLTRLNEAASVDLAKMSPPPTPNYPVRISPFLPGGAPALPVPDRHLERDLRLLLDQMRSIRSVAPDAPAPAGGFKVYNPSRSDRML